MPTYEYECPRCGHTFEKFQSMSDAPVKTCPKCKGRRVKRLIGTGAGLLFKGSGFYITDYRPDSYKEAAKKEKAGDKPKADKPAAKKSSDSAKSKKKSPRKKGA